MVLVNHSYSWWPMLVDCQTFICSWGHDFVGNYLVALQCKSIP